MQIKATRQYREGYDARFTPDEWQTIRAVATESLLHKLAAGIAVSFECSPRGRAKDPDLFVLEEETNGLLFTGSETLESLAQKLTNFVNNTESYVGRLLVSSAGSLPDDILEVAMAERRQHGDMADQLSRLIPQQRAAIDASRHIA